jgi:thiol-disulfide isomerase/thioredoxin
MNPNRHASTTPSVVPRPARLLLVLGIWLCAGPARAEEPSKKPPTGLVLNLADGGSVPGELRDLDRPGTIRWQSGSFAAPFEFPLEGVESVRFPVAEALPRAVGAVGFELTGGDVLFGTLLSLDEKVAELDVPRFGRLRVERSRIDRIFRWRDGSDLVYNGPNGLTGWREIEVPKPRTEPAVVRARAGAGVVINGNVRAQPAPVPVPNPVPPGPKWREEGGQLLTDREGAILQADIGLPARASLEFELSWKNKPDFTLALGVGLDEKVVQQAFRFEVWEGQLVALRETEKEGDLASIQQVGDGPGRAYFQAFLDQELGRLLVFSANGESLADLKLGARSSPALPGVRLTNHQGGLRLERLRVGRWDGEIPRPTGADQSRIHLADGSIALGKVERFDSDTREFVVRDQDGESRIATDRIASIHLARPGDEAPRAFRATYQDGTRLGGDWVKVEGGALFLNAPGITGTLRLPLDGMRSLDIPRREEKPREKEALTGTLEMDGLRLEGRLVDSSARPESSCLAWQPLASMTASPLLPGASGRIVYRSPSPKAAVFRQPAPVAPAPRNGLAGLLNSFQRTVEQGPTSPSTERRSLYLRTGDIIPSAVTRIDENGVTFRTDFSESTFVPHSRIKAVELAAESGAMIRVNKAKRERLLMLPRMQRDSPPMHLIRSKNGDILRGRVLSMDDKAIRVEIHLEEKEMPRDRVSRIIWLHPDETDPSKKPPGPPETDRANRVQAVRTDGIRLTFSAERFADGTLSGKSDVLGDCKVRLQDLDQLLIGGSVEKEATQLAYQQWKLQNAPEPKSAQADGGGSPDGNAGTESALVGKPAPDFELELLGGKKFHLAENKGKVIVLDFWATWCGPCLQAMPQIDSVTHEFADKGVQLIAVNLQETPAKISAMLERQKLSPTVALDRDGVVAAKYAANAIPQTVVIDREGKITRLFIGGGPKLGDQLREALQSLMPTAKP